MNTKLMYKCDKCNWSCDQEDANVSDHEVFCCPKCTEETYSQEVCLTCDDDIRKWDGRCSCDWCDSCDENITAGNCDCEEVED